MNRFTEVKVHVVELSEFAYWTWHFVFLSLAILALVFIFSARGPNRQDALPFLKKEK